MRTKYRENDAKYRSKYPPSFVRCPARMAALMPPAGRTSDLDEHGRGVARGAHHGGHHQCDCVVLWVRAVAAAAAPAALGGSLDLVGFSAKHRHLQHSRRYGRSEE